MDLQENSFNSLKVEETLSGLFEESSIWDELIDLPVLVVDDDQNCCENTVALLEEIGIDGEWVTSGEEAGVDEFIAKPLFRSRLTATFKNILEGKPSSDAKHYLSDIIQCDYTGKRVLLVEDNDLNSEIAKEIIGMTGAEVVTAENGKTAVDMISSGSEGDFDLIFMDIQMPVMNGYEATAAIRTSNIPAARSVPIVAMTANAFAEDVQLARSAGMNEHISKPLDMTRLRDVMRKWL